ncbi:MAG TPA: hypothetical protein VJI96_03505 [Candidatus Andersenbacteria bacterium]|nr:hypothetical protein [Candidatus Andersenbacteria bacterium]
MKTNQGSVVVYIILLIFVMMTSAGIVLSTILNKHIRASENYLISEQAFSGANSGVEHMLYKISKQNAQTEAEVQESGSITYPSGEVIDFIGKGCAIETAGQIMPHLEASGVYKGVVRRIEYGGGSDACAP